MPEKQRALAMADIAALLRQAAEGVAADQFYREVEQIAGETIGWRLFTILRYVEAAGAVERLYSSDRKAYPVGGRKPLDKIATSRGVLEQGECFLAANKHEVRQAFFDHELIFSLGISAILNAPIRHAGRRLGTLNLCGEEGMYGTAEIATARLLAGLLAPSLLVLGD